MNQKRMLGKVDPLWCPHCKSTPGPECPSKRKTNKQVRMAEKRELTRERDSL